MDFFAFKPLEEGTKSCVPQTGRSRPAPSTRQVGGGGGGEVPVHTESFRPVKELDRELEDNRLIAGWKL